MAAGSQGNDQSESTGASSSKLFSKLFLGGLSWETNEDTLRTFFSKFGSVEDVVVMRDRATRNPRGFGFITFQTEEAASAACKEVHCIDGRTIDAKPSVPQGEGSRPRSKKVFVGGLSPDTTEEEFHDYFSTFGPVAEATIMVDHTNNRSRGFGFVTFEDESSVHDIFRTGSMHTVGGKQVEVKSATPKGSGPVTTGQQPRGAGAFGRNGGFVPQQRSNASGMANAPMARGYEATFSQQGYGMAAFGGVNMAGQYGQYGYGMPAYSGYPGMMIGYGGYGGFGQYGQYGQQQQQQQQQLQQQQQQQQQQLQQQDGRRNGFYGGRKQQHHPPVMQMQALAMQGQSH